MPETTTHNKLVRLGKTIWKAKEFSRDGDNLSVYRNLLKAEKIVDVLLNDLLRDKTYHEEARNGKKDT